jgi:hypothetical protein
MLTIYSFIFFNIIGKFHFYYYYYGSFQLPVEYLKHIKNKFWLI